MLKMEVKDENFFEQVSLFDNGTFYFEYYIHKRDRGSYW